MYEGFIDTTRPAGTLIPKSIKNFSLNDGEEYRPVGVIPMTLEEWIAVPNNPIQRDTERRAERARHLDVFEPVHAEVSMALLPDGSKLKLDGHTRSHKWATGQVKNPPRFVEVKVYACRDLDVVLKLYGRHDSKLAVETTQDQLDGAARRASITFQSKMLKASKYANAVKTVYSELFGFDAQRWNEPKAMAEAVALLREELLLLDRASPTSPRFPGGIVQAALVTFMYDGEEALPFWVAYSHNQGQKSRERMDPVQALSESTLAEQKKRSKDANANLFRKGLSAYLAYRRGELYSAGKHKGLKGLDAQTAREFCRNAYRRRQARRPA